MHTSLPETVQTSDKKLSSPNHADPFATVFFANPVPMICLRIADRKLKMVNDSYLTLSGYTREELSELGPQHGLAPEARRLFYEQLLAGQPIHSYEATVHLKDSVREALLSAELITLEDEACALISVQDISERKRSVAALREQQEWGRQVLEAIPTGVVVTDQAGRITLVNALMEELFGYDRAEMIGQSIEMLVPVAQATNHATLREEYLKNAHPRPMSKRNNLYGLRKDGSSFPIEIGLNPILNSNGLVVLATINDITERLQTATALQKSQDNYRHLVENADDIIYLANLDGCFTYANPTALRSMHFKEEEVLGRHFLELVHPEERDKLRKFYGRQFMSREPNTYVEFKAQTKNQEEIWIGQKVQLVFEGERVSGFQAVARDITERINLEKQLKEARDNALATARLKSEFLANMSHEIRTPMNGVIGMTEILLNTHLSESQREYIETIRASSETLLTLINDILDFSKIEAGKLTIEAVDFDLIQVLEQTVEMFAEQTRAKGLELGTYVLPTVPKLLRGDPVRLRQVLTNLIGNGIKFTHSGEVFVTVETETETSESVLLRIKVKDTGIGIAAESLGLLFQPFTQADGSTTRKYGGTGLGLAISAQLVSLMGGTISVASKPGEGTTFTFTVQLAKQAFRATPLTAPEIKLAGLRALVVQDNPTSRASLLSQLKSWEIICYEASHSTEALSKLLASLTQSNKYDVVLIDQQMPDMDGVQLAQAIRHIPQLSSLPLVLLTPARINDEMALPYSDELVAWLSKPVRQSHLFERLTSLLVSDLPNEIADKQPHQPKAATRPNMQPTIAPSGSASTTVAPPAHNALSKRILIVDDNLINRKVGKLQIEGLGYVADLAINGLEAIAAVQRQHYDLIMMDCQMPQMDGFAATAAIRQLDSPLNRIPIIALTANALQGEREKCLAAGMDDYLSKPVKLEALKTTCERWLKVSLSYSQPKAESILPASPTDKVLFDQALVAALHQIPAANEPPVAHTVLQAFRHSNREHLTTLRKALETRRQPLAEQALCTLQRASEMLGAQYAIETCREMRRCDIKANSDRLQHLYQQLSQQLEEVSEAVEAGGELSIS